MAKRIYLIALPVIISLFLISCTHLEKPKEIIGKSDGYIDWGKVPPPAKDRAKHAIPGKRPFEWWYFDGHLDTGEYFVGTFFDPSFTIGKPGAVFTLYGADWSKRIVFKTISDEQMHASFSDAAVFCPYGYVKRIDDKTYNVRWDIDGFRAEFTLTTLAPGWRPSGGDGVNEDHLDFFWAIHQARNRIKGTITADGITRQVTGTGYFDHNWGKKPLNEITRHWVWGRILAGDYTIVYADVDYIDPSIKSRPLYIAKGDTIIAGTGSPTIIQSDFVTHPVLKRHYPRQIVIDYSHEGVEARLNIRQKVLVEDVDLVSVSGLNSLVQWIARTFIARPTYFRVIAHYNGEIVENGHSTAISGECLYEVMGFE